MESPSAGDEGEDQMKRLAMLQPRQRAIHAKKTKN
jgi:hypothetical protein